MKVQVIAGKVLYRTSDALIVLKQGPKVYDVPEAVYLANARQLRVIECEPAVGVVTTQMRADRSMKRTKKQHEAAD
jgi:hypothetical protein